MMLGTSGFAGQEKILSGEDIDNAIFYCFEGLEQAAGNRLNDALKEIHRSLDYDPCYMEAKFYMDILTSPDFKHRRRDIMRVLYNLKKREIAKADSLIRTSFSTDTKGYMYHILKGLIHKRNTNYTEAVSDLSAAIRLHGSLPYIIWQRGLVFMALDNFQDAESDFSTVAEMNTCSYRNRYQRGLARYKQGKYDTAIADFEHAMRQVPRLKRSLQESLVICEAYNMRGIQFIASGEYNTALADFNKAIILHPDFSEPYLNRGIVFRHLNILARAVQDFNHAIILNDKYVEAYFNRGIAFENIGRFDQAVKDFRTVLAFDPDHAQAFYHLGELYFKKEDYNTAIKKYTQSIKGDSAFIWTFYKRAQAYDRLRKYPGAIEDYDYFFKHAPDAFLEHKVQAWERSRLLKKWLHQVQDQGSG
jgi:tetratricopeptide (TPR) repeat protein